MIDYMNHNSLILFLRHKNMQPPITNLSLTYPGTIPTPRSVPVLLTAPSVTGGDTVRSGQVYSSFKSAPIQNHVDVVCTKIMNHEINKNDPGY